MSRRDCPLDCKIYVGGLPERASRSELEALFSRYGPLRNVWVARRPPGFAFVEFEDARDAEDACRALDGTRMCGVRARVELSSGKRRNRGGPGGYGGSDRGSGDRGGGRYDNGGDRGRGGRSPPVRRPSRQDSRSPRSRSPIGARRGGSPARSFSGSPPPRAGGRYNRGGSPNGSPVASRN